MVLIKMILMWVLKLKELVHQILEDFKLILNLLELKLMMR